MERQVEDATISRACHCERSKLSPDAWTRKLPRCFAPDKKEDEDFFPITGGQRNFFNHGGRPAGRWERAITIQSGLNGRRFEDRRSSAFIGGCKLLFEPSKVKK